VLECGESRRIATLTAPNSDEISETTVECTQTSVPEGEASALQELAYRQCGVILQGLPG
jgi:hypothetical protein